MKAKLLIVLPFILSVGILLGYLVQVLAFSSTALNPGHPASEIGGSADSDRIFPNAMYTFPGDLVMSGSVGIGTTSPLSKFDVKNPSGTDLQYVGLFRNLNNAANNNGLSVNIARSLSDAFALNIISGAISRLYVGGDGNVGIGTTEPASKLVVTGTVNIADKPGTDVNSPSLIIGDMWDTSAAGGVFDIADNVWLTQQRHRMYVLNGIRTDGDIIVETGNLNVGGNVGMGYERITNQCKGSSISSCSASCSAGKKVMGGGCYSNVYSSTTIASSYPSSETSWQCYIQASVSDPNYLNAYAICARITA